MPGLNLNHAYVGDLDIITVQPYRNDREAVTLYSLQVGSKVGADIHVTGLSAADIERLRDACNNALSSRVAEERLTKYTLPRDCAGVHDAALSRAGGCEHDMQPMFSGQVAGPTKCRKCGEAAPF